MAVMDVFARCSALGTICRKNAKNSDTPLSMSDMVIRIAWTITILLIIKKVYRITLMFC